MRVILKENIDSLGRRGDIVDVAPGYGRNFLIPKKLALEVTPSNMKMIEMEQLALRKKFEQEKATYQDLIDKLNETRLTFTRKTAEKDVIFGSVSSADIRDALSEQGMDVDRKKVLLAEPIKRLGNYTVPIKVFHDERAEVKIEVVTEEKERPLEETKDKADEEVKEVKKEEPSDREQEEVDKEAAEAEKKQEEKAETAETVIVMPKEKEEDLVEDGKPEETAKAKAEKQETGVEKEEQKGETAETVLAEPMKEKKKDTKETAETAEIISEEEKEEGEEDKPGEPPERKGKESDTESNERGEKDKKVANKEEA